MLFRQVVELPIQGRVFSMRRRILVLTSPTRNEAGALFNWGTSSCRKPSSSGRIRVDQGLCEWRPAARDVTPLSGPESV